MDASPRFSRFLPAGLAATLLLSGCDSPSEPLVQVHVLRIEPDSVTTLHRSVVVVQASAYDVHDNPVLPSQPYIWTTSDQSVATVASDPTDPRRATISTTGAGSAIIGLKVGNVATEMHMVVAGIVEGPYRVVHTGLRRADAFNDHGEVVVHEGSYAGARLTRWKDGHLVVQDGIGGNWASAVAITGTGDVLVLLSPCCNTGLLGWREIWLVRGSDTTSVARFALPLDISDTGVIVGAVQEPDPFFFRAAAWVNGFSVRFSSPHDENWISTAVAVNDRGHVAVNTSPYEYGSRAIMSRTYMWNGGSYSPVPAPDPRCSGWSALDLNRDGTVLLRCTMQDGSSATFLWDGLAVTSLAPLRGVGLNDRGEVIGLGPDGVYHWQAGRATRLFAYSANPPLVRINNAGQILLSTDFGAFLLQPEP